MSYEFTRNRVDSAKEVTKALPAAAAANTTDGIDLEQEIGGIIEEIAFELEVPALPNLADAKTVTFKVQDSADGVSFNDLDPIIQTTVLGASGAGSAAKKVRFRLPPHARRYVAINQAVLSAGGDNTAKSTIFRALF